jgi:gamma-tubulin complex component 5
LRQAILSILGMTLRFRDALTGDVGQAPTTTHASPSIRARLHRSWREQKGREGATGYALTSREVVLASDSESDPDEEALDQGSFGPNYYRISPISHDDQRLFGGIYEMQDELDKLVRFVRREVEGLVDSTSGAASAFSVLAFALEDWDR